MPGSIGIQQQKKFVRENKLSASDFVKRQLEEKKWIRSSGLKKAGNAINNNKMKYLQFSIIRPKSLKYFYLQVRY